MNAVALVFFTINIYDPSTFIGPQFSERLFESHAECAEFVNTTVGNSVVDNNFEFQFASLDGLLFKGGCYTAEEYEDLRKKYKLDS